MKNIAVYPGTFDPITNGHVDVIKRALKIFDKVIVAVVENPSKKTLFTTEERVRMIRELKLKDVTVVSFDSLLVDYLKKKKLHIVVRGLRAMSDFEHEFQMAVANNKLYPDMETIFIMTDKKYFYLNSSIVKEIARFGGCLKDFVPENVEKALKKKFVK